MPRAKSVDNESLLSAALEGLELQRQRIEEQIRQVRALLGGKKPGRVTSDPKPAAVKPARKRQLSAAARKRIAAAQKKRWAEYRKQAAGQGAES